MTITTPSTPTSGTRLFRWREPRNYPQLYFSAWYYFPRQYIITGGWWNIMQWKSETGANNDPFFVVNVGNDGRLSSRGRFRTTPDDLDAIWRVSLPAFVKQKAIGNGPNPLIPQTTKGLTISKHGTITVDSSTATSSSATCW